MYLCTEEYIQRHSSSRVFQRYIYVHTTGAYCVPFPCPQKRLFIILSNIEYTGTSYELMSSCWILFTLFLTSKFDLQRIFNTHNSYISLKAAHCLSSNRYSALLLFFFLYVCIYNKRGSGSSDSIANGYGLDGPGIECRWGGEIFRTCPHRPWGPPSLLYNRYRVFPGGKERPGHDAEPSPPSSAVVMKG